MASDDKQHEVVPLTRFRAALARARTTRRADAILADPDADRLIPSLPLQDLYLAIKDIGLEDAEELVARASPEQVQGFLDLDGWERDELSPDRLRPWIDMLTSVGPEKIAEIVEGLDAEEIALYVQKQANVYDLTIDEPPEEPEGQFFPTPDTFYLLDIKVPGEDGKALERFVGHLYRADLELGRRVMMSARWEIPSDLEEWAYRFRQGRMADLGFPDPAEAMSLYRPLDPASVRLPEPGASRTDEPGVIAMSGTMLPALVADALDARSLLGQALGTLATDEAIELAHAQLVTLFNRALAADRIEPADLAAARGVLDDVMAYLGLGLEYLTRGEAEPVARAGRALVDVPLERIFRVGYSLTASLGRLAETLFARGRVRLGEPPALLLDGRNREVVAALRGAGTRGRRPQMARVLDDASASGTRPFRSAVDVRLSASALRSASGIPVFFFDDLGLTEAGVAEAASSSPGVAFGTIARTLAARLLAAPDLLAGKDPLSLSPLRPPEVGSFLARLEDGMLSAADQASIGQAIAARLERRGRSAPAELETWFSEWFGELGKHIASVDGLYITG